ncbi:unnamed protein product [Ceratitis capitata]|uniref:(Mediterranean fruit fly) hypothetical protein n=1 Tax=Ceratitis capitata TaxID=7213 RepID=A0A811VKC1_CERCA|nr:unnamed protein product [Ceratitis capitata]
MNIEKNVQKCHAYPAETAGYKQQQLPMVAVNALSSASTAGFAGGPVAIGECHLQHAALVLCGARRHLTSDAQFFVVVCVFVS